MMRYIFLFLCIWQAGCRQAPPSSAKAYMEYLSDTKNGLKKVEMRNDIQVTALYQPTDLMVLNELEASAYATAAASPDSLKNKYMNISCFALAFSKHGREALDMNKGYGEYSALLQTLSFNMKDFILLTTDRNDTICVNDYLFQRTFNMSPANMLLLVFPAEKIRASEQLRLHVREFGLNTGNITFDFKTKNILNTPEVEWNDL